MFARRALSSSVCDYNCYCIAVICVLKSTMFLVIMSCMFLAYCSKVKLGYKDPIIIKCWGWISPPLLVGKQEYKPIMNYPNNEKHVGKVRPHIPHRLSNAFGNASYNTCLGLPPMRLSFWVGTWLLTWYQRGS